MLLHLKLLQDAQNSIDTAWIRVDSPKVTELDLRAVREAAVL